MTTDTDLRPGEVAVDVPLPRDASLYFIGRIRTPWTSRLETPRQGSFEGPVCRLEIFEPWVPALQGIDAFSRLQVLYWLNRARRDLVKQSPRHHDGETRGTFALRSPVRPNPIGVSTVRFVALEGSTVLVRGLDCLDETPLIDLKPDHCVFTQAPGSGDNDNA
ncbi:tRNA (N6-threonylcarbamoyladenosine(37)-N6)-methyltransferase TrmO [Bradyrhizobium sp. 83002]|uniref:tRNA (N6-threonylcarbamoyladenosine(37)-N6)-methyltransferase TrmO n=1 Tax=Bradyrhizobium aeschynomenes TaxID=2734909 RepID=UPI001552260E|nr:tRNA (N6-threonylcarbamoyladenosine(37)-N6)-methyltransferase TrmO [Bradyrhizobium aeschynomenes]NPU13680.1 tRNA (N6-threonylcarbamoyladenosine(37)-N6)-methyltransferase TrmO [Bradyrhizobium aeschynomenes]